MKTNLTFLIFISIFCHISALKCFQGLVNLTNGTVGAAVDCPKSNDVACVMHSEANKNEANFQCSNNNCSVNGVIVRESTCVNISTSQKNCCCYTDGCSSAFWNGPPKTSLPIITNATTLPAMNLPTSNATTPLGVNLSGSNATIFPAINLPVSNATTLPAINSTAPKPPPTVDLRNDIALPVLNTTNTNSSNPAMPGLPTLPMNLTAPKPPLPVDFRNDTFLLNSNTTKPALPGPAPPAMNSTAPNPPPPGPGDIRNGTVLAVLNTTNTNTSNPAMPGPPPPPMNSTTPKQPSSGPLKCVQGSYNTSFAITAVPTVCADPFAITCQTMYDSYSKFATFTCGNSNCTSNGRVVDSSLCVNVSMYQTNCCCYTDGCNTAMIADNIRNDIAKAALNTNSSKPVMAGQTSIIDAPLNSTNKTTVPQQQPSITSRDINKNGTSSGIVFTPANPSPCDAENYKILSASADPSLAGKGKFGGYLGYRSSCQQLCEKSFGLFKCVAYLFEASNRGKCTLFQQPIDDSVIQNPNSNATVATKC